MTAYICNDCGTDTTPKTGLRGWRSGTKTGQYAYCCKTDLWEYYMVTDAVWLAAGMSASTVRAYNETDGNFLCIGCLELRIGRQLTAADFTDCPVNVPDRRNTPRLNDRLLGIEVSS